MRFHAGHEIHASGKAVFQNARGQFAGHLDARRSDEDDVMHAESFNFQNSSFKEIPIFNYQDFAMKLDNSLKLGS
jgi:hypothetical protein